MSGGHFDYQQYLLDTLADELDRLVEINMEPGPNYRFYADEVMLEFENASALLRRAHAYVQRIDYLLSGDDGEEEFLSRLFKYLNACMYNSIFIVSYIFICFFVVAMLRNEIILFLTSLLIMQTFRFLFIFSKIFEKSIPNISKS